MTTSSSVDTVDPRQEYTRRLAARRAQHEACERRLGLLGNARFVVFLAGAFALLAVFALNWFGPVWLVVPVILFLGLSIAYQRAARQSFAARLAVEYYAQGLTRLEDRWIGTGNAGTRFLDPEHPNAADLDLFGGGSLFELLCTARTRAGEETLADWLRVPATPEEVRARQEAVAELRSRLDFREDLACQGAFVPAGVNLEGLASWGAAPPIPGALLFRVAATACAVFAVAMLFAWAAGIVNIWPFLGAILLEVALALYVRGRVVQILRPVEQRARDLLVFAGLLSRLEREHVSSPRLRTLREALDAAGLPPSRQMASLFGLLDLLDWRRNLYFTPFGALLLWTTHLAFAVERWRQQAGQGVGRWIEVVGQFEALASLATYAFENPDDPFPEVVTEQVCFDGAELGHPLLPRAQCIRNSVRLDENQRVLLVSGSNMSGKSTLLRTVGVNAVLALAGAPVRAKRLRLCPLAIGATLRIQDSLQAGRSRFYAEVLRVRQLVELAKGGLPLLFLLDEVFHGTNSHDRKHGAEAVVRGLVQRGAIGLVTTHDLALTHITEILAPRVTNVHFADHMEDGTIVFDYRMQPGVVQHSNALALMRAVGLDV